MKEEEGERGGVRKNMKANDGIIYEREGRTTKKKAEKKGKKEMRD